MRTVQTRAEAGFRPLGVGVGLSLGAGLIAGMFAGPRGAGAGLGFGLLATAIQLLAGRLMAGMRQVPIQRFMARWAAGMGLRLLGVVLVGIVIWVESPAVPALPAALAYVGVLIPQLFLEARRI